MKPIRPTRRGVAVLVILLVLMVALALRPAPLAPSALVELDGPADLQARFTQDAGQARLVVIVAPT